MGMSFTFGVDSSVKPKDQGKILNSICIASKHTYGNAHVLLLLETEPKCVSQFKYSMEVLFKQNLPNFDYDVVVATKLNVSREVIQKQGIYRFYQENGSDFQQYVRDNTIIICSGYALQAITLADDLSIECFYDYVFNKTYFYSPRTRTYVFPIDAINVVLNLQNDKWTPVDCSRTEFMYLQMRYIKEHYEALKNPPSPKRIKIIQAQTRDDWRGICEVSKKYDKVSWDIETDGFSFIHNKIGCLTLSFDGITGYYVPEHLINYEEFNIMLIGKYQIGANKKFDDKFMKYHGVSNAYTHSDVLHLGHQLNEMRFNGLKSLAYYYTQHGGYDFALDQYIQKFKPKSYLDIPILPSYAAQDAIHAYNIEKYMQEQLSKQDVDFPPKEGDWTCRKLYESIIIPYTNMFTDIELRGFNVDMENWAKGSVLLQTEILGLKEELRKSLMLSSVDSNATSFEDIFCEEEESTEKDELDSGKKLGEILEHLGWEDLGRTKGKWYKTGDDQLLRWLQLGHSEAALIQKMRSYLTLQKTFMGAPGDYTKGWKPHVVLEEGQAKIHPTYKPMLMDTMRNGCNSPNYMQIPATSKNLGKMVESFKRILSVPSKKKQYLVTIDYSGAQLRLAAIDSQDPLLLSKYQKNPQTDIHSLTAFNVFCKGAEFSLDEVILQEGSKTIKVFAHEKVKIIREGKQIEVKASDVLETDSLGGN